MLQSQGEGSTGRGQTAHDRDAPQASTESLGSRFPAQGCPQLPRGRRGCRRACPLPCGSEQGCPPLPGSVSHVPLQLARLLTPTTEQASSPHLQQQAVDGVAGGYHIRGLQGQKVQILAEAQACGCGKVEKRVGRTAVWEEEQVKGTVDARPRAARCPGRVPSPQQCALATAEVRRVPRPCQARRQRMWPLTK